MKDPPKWNRLDGGGIGQLDTGGGLRKLDHDKVVAITSGPSFYQSKPWVRFITALKKKRTPMCQGCGAFNVTLHGDHIKELKDGGEPFDELNIQLLCQPCHNRKTRLAAKRRKANKWEERANQLRVEEL